jgi:hypothetical protein
MGGPSVRLMKIVYFQAYTKILDSRGFSNQLYPMIKGRGRLLRAIGLPFVYVAMFSIAGGHWATLQVVAWTQMVQMYSRSASVVEALIKTFDGKHPCTLCSKVEEGRQKEKRAPATVKVDKKAEIFVTSAIDDLQKPFATSFSYPPLRDISLAARLEAPPRPVPRDRFS